MLMALLYKRLMLNMLFCFVVQVTNLRVQVQDPNGLVLTSHTSLVDVMMFPSRERMFFSILKYFTYHTWHLVWHMYFYIIIQINICLHISTLFFNCA